MKPAPSSNFIKQQPTALIKKPTQQISPQTNSQHTEKYCQEIHSKTQIYKHKPNSILKNLYATLSFPITLLLWYFTFEMFFFASIHLISDIYTSFSYFFTRTKSIFQENSLILLFWAVIIIKTKLPQIHRLYYHTIVKSILENEETQCSICLNDDCDYIMPKCQHHYHALCLEKWIKTQAYCPYCRTKTEKQLVRKMPWKMFLGSIVKNKVKWMLIVVVCVFVQYRFSSESFVAFRGRISGSGIGVK